jgi:hypothetical protein
VFEKKKKIIGTGAKRKQETKSYWLLFATAATEMFVALSALHVAQKKRRKNLFYVIAQGRVFFCHPLNTKKNF